MLLTPYKTTYDFSYGRNHSSFSKSRINTANTKLLKQKVKIITKSLYIHLYLFKLFNGPPEEFCKNNFVNYVHKI